MPQIRVTARLRRTVDPGSGNPGPPAGLAGPYATQVLRPFPTGDGTTWVFGLYGLADGDVVEWTTVLGEFDFVPDDVRDRHSLLVVYQGGDGGTVTAAVNGNVIGTAEYGALT